MSAGKLKCVICMFQPKDPTQNGNQPKVRNADVVFEGMSVCEQHCRDRRAMLIMAQQAQQAQQEAAERTSKLTDGIIPPPT